MIYTYVLQLQMYILKVGLGQQKTALYSTAEVVWKPTGIASGKRHCDCFAGTRRDSVLHESTSKDASLKKL